MRTFLPAMWAAFFIRVSPASRKAKPACMNMTSTAATTTQTVLAATSNSVFLGTRLHLLQVHPGSVVSDVRNGRRPDDPVARLVTAARGVGDRVHDPVDDLLGDDEHEQRLRQEARLEHAPPVLVRDASLAPVADGLDHRDADVARLVL